MNVQQLIAAMVRANATWGEERIAAELRFKLGLCPHCSRARQV
jgi:hypothetical protein